MKSLNLRHRQACSQNKALSGASPLWTHPSPTGDRQARAARVGRGNRGPREASFTKLQAGFIANQDSSGFCTVDICREGRSHRSAPQERHTARHTREGAPVVHPENRAAGTGEVISRSDHACQAPGHLSCSDRGRAQNTGPFKSTSLWSPREPEPEWLRPGKYTQPTANITVPGRLGKHTCCEQEQTQCGRDTGSTPDRCQ